jgi:hypothetical protein
MSAPTFAHWQAAYENHGIPLLPLEITATGKKPMVARPATFGLKASRELAGKPKFRDVAAFGFMAGARSRVTIVDVDATDERLLREVQDRHGESPFIARTGRGGYHVYYRYNGEQGKVGRVRPRPSEPIDVLHSGPVVAPPSQGTRAPYEIIHGTLEDLARLSVMCGLGVYNTTCTAAPRIGQGMRATALWEYCMRQARFCDDLATLIDVAHTWANTHLGRSDGHAFTDAEIEKAARSAWGYEERGDNRYGRHGAWFAATEVNHLISTDHDLFLLIAFLKANNGPTAEFMVANGLKDTFGWRRQRLADTRRRAEQGYIECVRRASQQRPALYRWTGQNKEGSGCPDLDTYPQLTPSPLASSTEAALELEKHARPPCDPFATIHDRKPT